MTNYEFKDRSFKFGQRFRWKQYEFNLTGVDWEAKVVYGRRGEGTIMEFDIADVYFHNTRRRHAD